MTGIVVDQGDVGQGAGSVGAPAVRRLGKRERLELFDRATERRKRRERPSAEREPGAGDATEERGWTRGELYDRGRSG